jgi:5-methylcytosine-specific restriction endonuclease McrBC GTP-binding regulatory subunit McrB
MENNKRFYKNTMWKIDTNTNKKDVSFIQNLHDELYNLDNLYSSNDDQIIVIDRGIKQNDRIGAHRLFEVVIDEVSTWYSIFFYNRQNGNTVAVHKDNSGKNAIQLVLDKYIERQDDKIVIWHDGIITGSAGLTKEVMLQKVKEFCPHLFKVDNDGLEYIELGSFNVEMKIEEIKLFVTNLIKYCLIREKEKKINFSMKHPFEEIIAKYKTIAATEGIKEEAYKWQLIQALENKPNIDADNLAEEFKQTYYINLVFPQFYSVQKFLSINATDGYRQLYQNLFDELVPLQERVIAFIDGTLTLYRATPNNAHGTHHDERSIATILAIKFPDKYALYKASFYAELCKILGEPKAKVKYRYVHYLSLLENLKYNYLSDEIELIAEINELLTEENKPFYNDNNLNILAQDILYRVLDPSKNNMTFEKLVEVFFESLEDEVSILRNFKKGSKSSFKGKEIFAWVQDHLNVIGDLEAHYEFYNVKDEIFVDLHFEAPYKDDIIKYQPLIKNLPEKIIPIDWWQFKSLRYQNIVDGEIQDIKITDPDAIEKLKEALLYFEENIANQIRAIKTNSITNTDNNNNMNTSFPLNQILYGPPGTGKTYNSINKALEIIENKNETELLEKYKNREGIKNAFDLYLKSGQIAFTTFHQSMSYEDFIEGIKPDLKTDTQDIKYVLQQGIFKQICNNAKQLEVVNINVDWDNTNYYKMSIGGKNKPDVHSWCVEHQKIALGYGGDSDLSDYLNITDWIDFKTKFNAEFPELVAESKYHIQSAYAFINLKIGDVVIITKGNRIIDAIGVIKSNYYWDDNTPLDYFHFRDVEWIAKDLNVSPERFIQNSQISQMTIYQFDKVNIVLEAFKDLTNNQKGIVTQKPFVLIIDEINRGNVSKIFGELITLIEDSKRIGKSEELKAILPYSKDTFGVPDNVHIIGTMNTADRSVEALDTALRRRFEFIEMMPNTKMFTGVAEYNFNGINVSEILTTLNNRIEVLLGRDHQIGHSFFILNQDNKGNYTETIAAKLYTAFNKNIIPLLQEYFYGDYNKIGLVLGDAFVTKTPIEKANDLFASSSSFNGADYIGQESNFKINNFINEDGTADVEPFADAIRILMNTGKSIVVND